MRSLLPIRHQLGIYLVAAGAALAAGEPGDTTLNSVLWISAAVVLGAATSWPRRFNPLARGVHASHWWILIGFALVAIAGATESTWDKRLVIAGCSIVALRQGADLIDRQAREAGKP